MIKHQPAFVRENCKGAVVVGNQKIGYIQHFTVPGPTVTQLGCPASKCLLKGITNAKQIGIQRQIWALLRC